MRNLGKLKRVISVVSFVLGLALLQSCSGKSVYVAPGSVTQSGTYSDTDMRMMAQSMYNSMMSRLQSIIPTDGPKPVVALVHLENKTSEHIDTDMIADKLQIELIKAGALRFVDRTKIKEISKEFDLGGSGMVNPETVKKAGSVLGADYLLTGDLSGISKSDRRSTLNYYRLSMRIIGTETDEIVWADDFEIKKAAGKNFLDW
jgi:uncharacterized protein (TIGR02722 family)